MAVNFSAADIQILVATMNRSSLDFLLPMFPNRNLSSLNLVVVNQVVEGNYGVESGYPGIKIINTLTKGLSVSRNIALDNATGKLCVIADDDVVFEEGFEEHILKAFECFPEAAAVTFQYNRPGAHNPVKTYMPGPHRHAMDSLRGVSSVEIVVNLHVINKKRCRFNSNFGLGAFFEVAEEFLFLRLMLLNELPVYYYPAAIVQHEEWSSGRDHGSDRLVYARAALACKLYGSTAGLWLIKYLQFLVRKKLISVTDVPAKFKVGINGIKKYKILLNLGKESRHV